jgi:hypothetical protein
MKLTQEYIIERLQTTSVHDLAVELAGESAEIFRAAGGIDLPATIKKYESMLKPLAPVEVKAADLMESMGVNVVKVDC